MFQSPTPKDRELCDTSRSKAQFYEFQRNTNLDLASIERMNELEGDEAVSSPQINKELMEIARQSVANTRTQAVGSENKTVVTTGGTKLQAMQKHMIEARTRSF
jgi:hypothetical protein